MGLLAQVGTCSGIWLLTAVSRASSCEAGQPQGGTLERSELVGATSGPLDLWTSGAGHCGKSRAWKAAEEEVPSSLGCPCPPPWDRAIYSLFGFGLVSSCVIAITTSFQELVLQALFQVLYTY